MENWKPVLGWEGFYEVSDQGHIQSCPRRTRAGWAGFKSHGRIIATFVRQKRRFVNLFDGDKRATCTVHRLMLEAFVSPRPDGMECRHLDGNSLNNTLENLRWGTKAENETDKFLHGNRRRPPLTSEEVNDIRTSSKKQQELADQYQITQSLVSRIKSGERRVP